MESLISVALYFHDLEEQTLLHRQLKTDIIVIVLYDQICIFFCLFLFTVCEKVPSDEQQRRKIISLQDHRVSSHQLLGMNWLTHTFLKTQLK